MTGSKRAATVGWRDMWALLATVRRGRLHGESFSKSPDFNSWGAAVALRAEVPLAAAEDTSCALWSDIQGKLLPIYSVVTHDYVTCH